MFVCCVVSSGQSYWRVKLWMKTCGRTCPAPPPAPHFTPAQLPLPPATLHLKKMPQTSLKSQRKTYRNWRKRRRRKRRGKLLTLMLICVVEEHKNRISFFSFDKGGCVRDCSVLLYASKIWCRISMLPHGHLHCGWVAPNRKRLKNPLSFVISIALVTTASLICGSHYRIVGNVLHQ